MSRPIRPTERTNVNDATDPSHRGALAAAMAAVFLGAVDLTVIATLLPSMVLDLGINTADLDRYVWVVTAYLLAYVIAIPVVGRLSDILGRRTMFEAALLIFTAGSLWCALANDLASLIAARTLQGVGGGALLPVTMALVGDLLPPGRRLTAIGLVGAVDTLGWVVGPIWGAAIVNIVSNQTEAWRWVFWINLPLSAAAVLALRLAIPRGLRVGQGAHFSLRHLDFPGFTLLAAAMTLLNVGLSAGGEIGATAGSGLRAFGGTHNPLSDHVGTLIASGVVILAGFILWERRTAWPIVPIRLFEYRVIASALVGNALIGAALIVTMVDVPVVVALLVDPDRISAISAAVLAPFTIAMAGFALSGGVIAGRIGVRIASLCAIGLVAVGYTALWVGLRSNDYPGMIPGLIVAGMGFGMIIAPLGAAVIDAAPEEDRGAAAALAIVARLLGMTLGMSALTAFGVRRLQSLTARTEPIVRGADETTAEYLVRQSEFIEAVAIPLSLRVVRETFLIAAAIALAAAVPIWLLTSQPRRSQEMENEER